MPQKRALSLEERVKVIEDYIAGKHGFKESIEKYGISLSTFYNWVRLYRVRGAAGLIT